MPWSWVYTEKSIHQVQHTLSSASTQECLSSLHSDHYELTPECRVSFRHASLQDRPPPASSPWELKGKVTSSHSSGCKLTNWWTEFKHPACIQVLLESCLIGLPVHLQTRSITASKCISEFSWSRPPSASPNSLNYGLWVHTIRASKCISKLAQSSLSSAPPNSLDYPLQVHLWVSSITASRCISTFARSQPPSASLRLNNHCIRVYLWVHLIINFRRTSNSSQALPAATPDMPCVDE